jgi:hypothetical protein
MKAIMGRQVVYLHEEARVISSTPWRSLFELPLMPMSTLMSMTVSTLGLSLKPISWTETRKTKLV